MPSTDPVYLPRQRTRIGKAGYKGKNVKIVEPEQGDTTDVVTTPKAPVKSVRTSAPKSGIKPLKKSS